MSAKESTNAAQGFTRQAMWLTATNAFAFALSFTTPLLLVRALSQTEFGLYKQAFQILTTALGMLNLQVAMSVFYFLPRAGDRRWQVVLNVLLFYAGVGALLAIDFTLYPGWVRLLINSPELVEYMPSLGVAISLWLFATNLEVIPLALGDVRTSSIFIVGSQLSKSTLMISVALLVPRLEMIIYAAIVQGTVQMIFFFYYLHRTFGPISLRPDFALFRQQMKYSLPYGIGTLVASVNSDLHNYFVSYFFTPTIFAVYAVGCFQLPLLSLMATSFGSVLSPEISRLAANEEYGAIFNLWRHAVLKLTLALAPCLGLAFLLRREIITLLFTESYAGAVPIFGIYLLGIITLLALPGSMMRAFAEFRYFRLKLSLLLLPVTAGAIYLGLKTSGLLGVVAAVVGMQIVEMAITVRATMRRIEAGSDELRTLAPMLRIAICALGAAIVAWPVRLLLTESGPRLLTIAITSVFFIVAYLFAIFTFKAVTDEEKEEVRALWLRLQRALIACRGSYLRWSVRG